MCGKNEQASSSDCGLQCRKVVGFDAENIDCLALYICHICTFLLRNPFQLNCGHRYCQSCIEFEGGTIIKCTKCNEETPRDSIIHDRGCQRDMENLNINCSLCEWKGIFKHYQEHLDTDHLNPFCQQCGKEFETVNCLTQHKSVCDKITIDCLLKPYGCDEQFLRVNARDHYLSEQHQSVLLKFLSRNVLHPMSDTDARQVMSSHMDRVANATSDSSHHQLLETMHTLMNGIQVLNDDTQRLSSESLRHENTLEFFCQDFSKLKTAIQETHSFADAHKSNQQILEQSLASLQQEVIDYKSISYDGTLIWKITDVHQKIADAQCERQTSIYSPIFYSSPNGYKMRARVYLAGDGNARRSHVSIFIVLMRGEYDAVLQFPFTYKVTFCLFDQTMQQRHIIDSFRPDPKSNSFQRPRSDMNIASGIPKFVPLSIVQQDSNPYVCDDTMFIKVMIDFGEMPKTILPYTLSLNPGIPILIQQEFIKRELERRAQQTSAT